MDLTIFIHKKLLIEISRLEASTTQKITFLRLETSYLITRLPMFMLIGLPERLKKLVLQQIWLQSAIKMQ